MASHVDGNALAGILSELIDFDATTASGQCRSCGDDLLLARAMVYADAPGMVARCYNCGEVLLVVITGGAGPRMFLHSLANLHGADPDR
jgi:ribosomal protein S27E